MSAPANTNTNTNKSNLSGADREMWKQFFRTIEPRGLFKTTGNPDDLKVFKMACADFSDALKKGRAFACLAHYEEKVKTWLLSNDSRAPVDDAPRCENGFMDII